MKIFMLSTQNTGIAWWRHQAPAKALRAAGHEVTVFEEPELAEAAEAYGGIWGWLCANLDKYDIVHSGYSSADVLTKILVANRHKNARPFIVDIDDDLETVPAYNQGFKTFGPATLDRQVVRAQLLVSDAMSVSTQPLLDTFKFKKPKFLLPNMVYRPDWDHPVDPAAANDASVRILLAGGESRYADWAALKEALPAIVARYDGTKGRPKARIMFFGWYPDWAADMIADPRNPDANAAIHIHSTGNVARFCQTLRWLRPDLYLSPVLKNPFNASKSNLKALEAGMCGAALVCTDFTTYDTVPNDTCFKVANTPVQWTETLSAAIEDAAMRKRVAGNCAEWVRSTQDITKHIKLWEDTYAAVLAQPPITKLEDLVGPQPE